MLVSPKCISDLRIKLPSFSPKVRLTANYIIAHPEDVISCSIQTLSQKIGVSQYTVLNCVREIGYHGYSDFRMDLAVGTQQVTSKFNSVPPSFTKDNAEIYKSLLDSYETCARCLLDTAQLISAEAFVDVVHRIFTAKRISIYGLGTSGYAAQYLCLQLVRLGMHAVVVTEGSYQLLDAATLIENDLVLAFSSSGATPSVVEALKHAKLRSCYTIAITSLPSSVLAQEADLTLLTTNSAPGYVGDTLNSIVEQIAFSTAIASAVYKELQGGRTRTI